MIRFENRLYYIDHVIAIFTVRVVCETASPPATSAWPPPSLLELALLPQRLWEGRSYDVDYSQVEELQRNG